jgi:hypothetical protein
MNKYLKIYFRNRERNHNLLPSTIENYEVQYLDYVDPSTFKTQTVYQFLFYNLHRTKEQILNKVSERILTDKGWQSKLDDEAISMFMKLIPQSSIDPFIDSLLANDNIGILLKYALDAKDTSLKINIIEKIKMLKNKEGS